MHYDMLKIQDNVAIVEKLNYISTRTVPTYHLANTSRMWTGRITSQIALSSMVEA